MKSTRSLLAVLSAVLLFPAANYAQMHDHDPATTTTIAQNGTRGPVIHLKSGTETIEAELYLGMGKQRVSSPALVLIPEWWGLNDWVRDQARQFAAAGYSVVTVDLYRGQTASDMETAHQLSRALPHDRILRDMEAAVAYLRERVDPNGKIGVVGWCMGGGLALDLAVEQPNLQAVVVNYGAMPTDPELLKKIQAPVLGNFGGLDKGITPAMVDDFSKQMKALGKSVNVKVYPDAGHAFENENNKTGYNADDTVDAKRRALLFLNSQLKR